MEDVKALQLLARLDRIPIWPYSYWIIFTVGAGFFFAFFDIITIGLALPIIAKQFQVSTAVVLWAITSGLIGYIIGSFLDSRLSDLLGRKLALIVSMLLFSIGSLLSATSPNITWLIIWRFIIGTGIGAEIANVTTYIGELAPASCRGRYASITIAAGFIGFAVVPFIGLALIPNFAWGWRALFACGALGGFLILFCRRYIPNSIRWQINHQHYEIAEQELLKAENIAIKRLKKNLPTPTDIVNLSIKITKTRFIDLFRPPYLNKIIFFAVIWLIYYLGNYGWLALSTNLFLSEGFDLTKSLALVATNSLGFVIGSVLAIFLGDKFERKQTISVTALIWAIALLFVAWLPHLFCILIFGCLATTTIALVVPLLYIYTAESFPTSCRATGVSITDGVGHLSAAFCGQIILGIAGLFTASGYSSAIGFTIMAITGLLTSILILFGSKMTGKQLHQ